jgi:aryl-alcohol dehydrogenase
MQIMAAVTWQPGAPFTLTEVELQAPAPDEVVVQIAGVGVCHTDIGARDGQTPFPLPGVVGHEVAGAGAVGLSAVLAAAVRETAAFLIATLGPASIQSLD